MNKRQTKKQKTKGILLLGMSYKEHRKANRAWQEYKIDYYHAHKIFKGFSEDEKDLIEMGILTEEEIKKKYGMPKDRIRRRKFKRNTIG